MLERQIRERTSCYSEWLGTAVVERLGFDAFNTPSPLLPHAHSGHEFTCVFSGEVRWITEQGEVLQLSGGHMALTQPNVVHFGEFHIITPSAIFWMVFNLRDTDITSLGLTSDAARELDAIFTQTGNAVVPMPATLTGMLRRLHHVIVAPPACPGVSGFDSHIVRAMLPPIIFEIAAGFSAPQPPQQTHDRIADACRFIVQHLDADIGIDAVAEHVGLSSSRLHALFRREMGMTPGDYRRRQRCAVAEELLRTTNRTITDIAFTVGFTSSQYFATTFRRFTGQTPRDYRRSEKVQRPVSDSGNY